MSEIWIPSWALDHRRNEKSTLMNQSMSISAWNKESTASGTAPCMCSDFCSFAKQNPEQVGSFRLYRPNYIKTHHFSACPGFISCRFSLPHCSTWRELFTHWLGSLHALLQTRFLWLPEILWMVKIPSSCLVRVIFLLSLLSSALVINISF